VAGAGPGDGKTRALLVCGVIAGPLFTVAWVIEGAARAGYDPLRHPVSSLALGDAGWTQSASFIVTGLLLLAFAGGLPRVLRPLGGSTWGPLLLGAVGIGLLGAGVFVADPIGGYPPGTPAKLQSYSVHGALHQLFSTLVFVGFPAACLVFARRFAGWGERGWAIYSALTAVVFVVAFVLADLAFSQTALAEVGGLFQRIALIAGFGWVTLLALHLLQTRSGGPGPIAV
jgi:hypothetical protein